MFERNRIEAQARNFFHHLGLDVRWYYPHNDPGRNRTKFLEQNEVSLVLDVGANIGFWAQELRQRGYNGRIVSFEPASQVFAKLKKFATSDPGWECRQLALGKTAGKLAFNLARESVSSSLLEVEEHEVIRNRGSEMIGREEVPVVTLDSIYPEIARPNDRVYLKIDVQGYEMEVFQGASNSLRQIKLIESELSLVPFYKGQPLFLDIMNHLCSAGFRLASLEKVTTDTRTGHLLQVDGIFVRD